MKAAIVRARVEENLKVDVEAIFNELGLSTSEAINLFLAQVRLKRGLPFPIQIPNEITAQTFTDTDVDRNLVPCTDAEDMFKKLGI